MLCRVTQQRAGLPQRRTLVSAGASATAAALRTAPGSSKRVHRIIQHIGSCNASQFSSFQGSKMLLPECWMPLPDSSFIANTGARSKLAVSNVARRKPVLMSFLGVGAPEAVLVVLVALVVFGPKGLAEAAKSLGRTLKAFQPTIREVVEVSQDIKGTLEKELGLDEMRSVMRPTYPPPARSTAAPSALDASDAPAAGNVPQSLSALAEPSAADADPDIEAKRAASAAAAWGSTPPQAAPSAPKPAPEALPASGQGSPDLSALSLAQLEAELAARRAQGGESGKQ